MVQKTEELVVKDFTELWTPVSYKVVERKEENLDTISFLMKPNGKRTVEDIQPGQFNMLYAFGKGEVPISVSSLRGGPGNLVHTIQDVGKISGTLCNLQPGDTLGVRGPFGSVWPIEKAKGKDVIIMAGGLGIAPLRPVIEYIAMNREDFGDVNVLYGTRSPETMAFHRDIISWQADPTITFLITVHSAMSKWGGRVGLVTDLVRKATFDPENTLAMVCGPEIMMRFSVIRLEDAGMSQENIYVSMERNMKCGVGHCGHCQYGPEFICKDGPVFPANQVMRLMNINEL